MAGIESKQRKASFTFDIQSDMQNALDVLTYFEDNEKKMRRAVLAGIGTTIKNKNKRAYPQFLGKGTGALRQSIKRKVTRDGGGVVIEAKARAKNKQFYGYALAEGSDILAHGDGYLKFQIDGKWKTMASVKLPEKDFMVGPAKEYMNSPEYRQQIDRIIEKQIAKVERKYGTEFHNAKAEAELSSLLGK